MSLLLLEELCKLRISCCDSLFCILLLHKLSLSEISTVPDLACFPSLLLFDVIEVGVAEETETGEDQSEVSLTLIVEHVWLVPVGEHTLVHMSQRRLLTWLQSAIYATASLLSLKVPYFGY